ncbi:carboxymuconolactone decarboxylase family protein [Mucilaginibacter sp. SP1R1]|uniref:carboxymuconolactone decarboxylase family protein n=1 Tax=Mucilaginibacter sp. SP1R1 TaxID=2723091 RepID=UPI001607EC4A|nr:carboxymuconolactone decarboxylase family protein [Mucilaginibacter sp. SP1R1]MBB6149974.1 alkylhydroperoxidase/carboxymuconolactone decarboxylase family protein YurZ [Mucilaginibacter sp. SP1R1]
MKKITLIILMLMTLLNAEAQNNKTLNKRQQSIVCIAALTAKGKLPELKSALHEGLDAGMTVNEIKEMMIHLYAYCGFPRSLNGINTFITVMDERKAKGIKDPEGMDPTSVVSSNKYALGKNTLDQLTGRVASGPPKGYAAFVPAIDTMLKEHLFADIFGRGVLTSQERELTTVSALVSLGGVESQLSGHLGIAMHTGLSREQLQEMFTIQEIKIGKSEADAGRAVLTRIGTGQQ